MGGIVIRDATLEDAPALLGIYAHYVERTAVSFEYATPTPDEFRERIARVTRCYPWLVAQRGEEIVGYAYAGPFKERAAYDWSAELTIYLAPGARRRGFGRALYGALEAALSRMGIRNLYACIACPRVEDEYLTLDSVRFHRRLGFSEAGRFNRCAWKFGRWYDMVWMEKHIAGEEPPNPVRWRRGADPRSAN